MRYEGLKNMTRLINKDNTVLTSTCLDNMREEQEKAINDCIVMLNEQRTREVIGIEE